MEWEKIIEEIANECGIMLIKTRISRDFRNPHMKVTIDTRKAITMEEITLMTKQIKKSDRINNLFRKGYGLEVTSPGLNYPLTEEYQFQRNIGNRMIIKHTVLKISNPIEGVLKDFKEGVLVVESGDHFYNILFSDILEGKLILR